MFMKKKEIYDIYDYSSTRYIFSQLLAAQLPFHKQYQYLLSISIAYDPSDDLSSLAHIHQKTSLPYPQSAFRKPALPVSQFFVPFGPVEVEQPDTLGSSGSRYLHVGVLMIGGNL
jgi:hypothetical protein